MSWKQCARQNNAEFAMTYQTYEGFLTTLSGTLGLAKHLFENHYFDFFMPERISQNRLEVSNDC